MGIDSGEDGKEKGTRLSRSLEQAKAEFEMFRSRRRSSCRHMRQLLTLTGLTFPEKLACARLSDSIRSGNVLKAKLRRARLGKGGGGGGKIVSLQPPRVFRISYY